MAKKTSGSAKRFGPRYGRRIRQWLGAVEKLYRTNKNICPYCKKNGVKRKASGIWNCAKCNSTWAGKAYTMGDVRV